MRREVKKFAEKMEETLARNDYKPGWKNCTFVELFSSLRGEVSELWEVYRSSVPHDPAKMIHESIDIATFAMMIADNLGGLNNEEVS